MYDSSSLWSKIGTSPGIRLLSIKSMHSRKKLKKRLVGQIIQMNLAKVQPLPEHLLRLFKMGDLLLGLVDNELSMTKHGLYLKPEIRTWWI